MSANILSNADPDEMQCILFPLVLFLLVLFPLVLCPLVFLPLVFVGLDHNKEMVYEHCKKLLENLMLLAANQDHPEVARLLLSYQTNLDDTLEMISEVKDTSPNETGNIKIFVLFGYAHILKK